MVEFFAPMERVPTRTEQQHRVYFRNGKINFARDPKLQETIETLKAAILPHRPEIPIDAAVYVKIIWCFPYRKSEKKSRLGQVIPKDTRPDIDNLNKALLDILNETFIRDDSQVVRLTTEKCWFEKSGIYIKISEIDEDIYGAKIRNCIDRAATL